MQKTISITAISSISPLGNNPKTIWENYLSDSHCFTQKEFGDYTAYAAFLDADSKQEANTIKQFDNKYKSLDSSVLYAITASRKAIALSSLGVKPSYISCINNLRNFVRNLTHN